MADSQSDSNAFIVRIVSIDHYMAPPTHGLDISYSGKVNEVPVIRIYGSTPAGQKTCTSMGFYPIYMCLVQIYRFNHTRKLKGNAGSKRQHVHGCSLVRNFYGYHSSEEIFLKLHLYYRHVVSCAANLLLVHFLNL